MAILFHLDEHVPNAVALGLRRHGIDVTTTADAGLLSSPDEVQLAYALSANRVIVTHDEDFLSIAVEGGEHAGIAYCHQDTYQLGKLLDALIVLHGVLKDDEMRGHIEYL